MKKQFIQLLALLSTTAAAQFGYSQTSAFTYQGQLNDGSKPANGDYALQFSLYDSKDNHGGLVAGPIATIATLSNGLFTVTMDFGSSVFDGTDRWLEIGVSNNASGAFVPLHPRQQFTSTPYAIRAATFSGPIANNQLPANVARVDGSGRLYVWSGGDKVSIDTAGNLRTAGAINPASDRNVKAGFQPSDPNAILEKVAALPITRWHYTNDPATPHLGPMAQDFSSAFGVGSDDKHIATVDADGVALAAIQGLNQKLETKSHELEVRTRRLEAENAELKQHNDSLEKRIRVLEDVLLSRNPHTETANEKAN